MEDTTMASSVLDLKNQLPDILRALNRQEKVVVSYGDRKLALLQPLPEGVDAESDIRDNPAFGIWRDREDLADPAAYVRTIRRGRGHAL